MKLHYRVVDVFTDRAFGGNPLAVFPDAAVQKNVGPTFFIAFIPTLKVLFPGTNVLTWRTEVSRTRLLPAAKSGGVLSIRAVSLSLSC